MANPLTNRKFIHFNRLENFENQLQNNPGSILDTQIVFIKDARKIWTHGTYYTLDERITNDIYSKLEALAEISTDIIQKLDEAQFISAGPTADRPTGGGLQQGICYLDTTLNEPIWWDGTNWIDATGNNADLPHSGTTAQKPNIANVKIGFDYLDTTTGEFFISDGTQWVQFNKPATQTTPGIIQPRHTGTTNKSGLLITDNQGSLQVNTSSDLGLYINDMGLLQANIKGAATDAEIEAGTSTTKALTPSNMDKIEEIMTNSFISDPTAGHEYVEIGGIKWATMNIGASSETDDGLYFQWGDTQGYTKDEVGSGEGLKYFGWEDYKYGNGTSSPGTAGMTKYNETDSLRTLELSDDAAKLSWGSQWRMPTLSEFNTLLNSTTNEWVTDYQGSGVNGRLFTDKTDSSKTLFFPASGHNSEGMNRQPNDNGYYWANLCYNGEVIQSHYLVFSLGDYCRTHSTLRYRGFTVRGVLDNSVPPLHKVAVTGDYNDLKNQPDFVNNGSYNSTTKEIELKHDDTILATIDATAFIKDGMVDSVAILNDNLVITFNTDAGKQPISIPLTQIFNPSNYYTKSDIDTQLAAKADLVNGVVPTDELPMEEIKAEVEDDLLPKDPAAGYEYVDLGLPSGILWAKTNIGAESEEESGAYFSWGNIVGHKSTNGSTFDDSYDFGTSNSGPYASTTGASISFTSYTGNADYSANSGYDAARENLGGLWRTPTGTEFQELADNTDREWTTINGVRGYKFMKKSDHSVYIFLPAAGYGNGTSITLRPGAGLYWSSSLYSTDNGVDASLNNSGAYPQNRNKRFYGCTVRGVLDAYEPSKLHKVAVSGDYNDLENKPGLATDTDIEEGTSTDKVLTPSNMEKIKSEVVDSIMPEPEYVDLGLPSGILWAKANIGADSETDYGEYFSWGNVEGHKSSNGSSFDNGYDWGSSTNGAPYNTTPGYSLTGNIASNDANHDVAKKVYGGSWHMPTKELFQELYDNTDREWVTNYQGVSGLNGWKFKNKTDATKFVFFPASGCGDGASLYNRVSLGTYWSSSYGNSHSAYGMNFGSSSVNPQNLNYRYYGFSVRAVRFASEAPSNKLHKVALTGNYNDLKNKPTIPAEVTETTVSNWGFTKNTGTYSKPTGGIPKIDLATDVQTSLGKADTAVQPQDLSSYADGAEYDSTNHLIYLKHGNTRLSNPINATDFIKDGMIENVTIEIGESYYLYENAAAAVTAWNSNASLPTEEDFLELRDNTNYEWATIDGVFGGKFINKTDSTKFIFLPAFGYYSNGAIRHLDKYGYYLSSTSYGSNLVKVLLFGENDYRTVSSDFYKVDSGSLRAVSNVANDGFIDLGLPSGKYWATENVYNTGTPTYQVETSLVITFNTDSGKEPITIPLSKIFNPDNYYNKEDINLLLGGKVDVVSGKGLSTNDYTTTEKNKLAGIENGAQVNVLSDWNATSGAAQILNKPEIPELPDPAEGHDYVEIAGIKWATMNIGANSVTDFGLYFAWGDTQGYTAEQVGSGEGQKYFGWADYKYGNGTSSPGATGMTKYNDTDGKTVLDLEDDAARANWGGSWRMPTTAEFQALGAAVNTAWTQVNNVYGILCTDKTDSSKTLFFPAAGYCYNGSVGSVGNNGSYWSSSLYANYRQGAYYLSFNSNSAYWDNSYSRYCGCAVRGVLDTSATQLHKVAITGDYNDLENKPTPTTAEEVAAGTATNKALTPANLNDILAVLLGKNFGNSNHTIEELFQYVLNQIEPVREFVDLGLPSGKLWAAEDVTGDDAKYIENGYYYYAALDDNDTPVAANAVALWAHNDSTVSLPTKDDVQELIDNTNYTTVTINGVNYSKFTSKVDATKYITIPMAGYNWRGEVMEFGEKAYTWTSTSLSVQERRYYNLEADDTSAEVSYSVVPSGHILRAIRTPEPIPVEGDV